MTRAKAPQRPRIPEAQLPPKYLWHQGKLQEWDKATIHATALGWTAIGAVFEGIRAYWSPRTEELYLFLFNAHLKRLAQSMKLMRMAPTYSGAQIGEAVRKLLQANSYREDVYLQPIVYFSEQLPGYMPVLQRPVEVLITTRPAPSQLEEMPGAHAGVSSWMRLADNVMPPRAKALANYQNSRLVSTEAQVNGYDFGIILNQQGKVAEAAYACVFLVRDGVAITPPLTAGILESITRQAMITLLRDELHIPVQEREVDRTELYVADEVFLCGTSLELRPLLSVDRYQVGDGEPGPITRRLGPLMAQIARGGHSRYRDWNTPVYDAASK